MRFRYLVGCVGHTSSHTSSYTTCQSDCFPPFHTAGLKPFLLAIDRPQEGFLVALEESGRQKACILETAGLCALFTSKDRPQHCCEQSTGLQNDGN